MKNLVVVALVMIISYVVYYLIGKTLGAKKYGRLMTIGIITLLWVINSVRNAGGFSNLIWLLDQPGVIYGWIGSLITMQITAKLGNNRPLNIVSKKEKWLL